MEEEKKWCVYIHTNKINNKVYNFSSNGSANVGFKKINSKFYYFNSNGTAKSGWTIVKKNTYYFNKSGKIGVYGANYTGIKKIGSKKYLFSNKGVLQTGVKKYKNKYYIFDTKGKVGTKGKMLTNGWQTLNNKYYYAKANGQLIANSYYNGYKFTKSACLDSQSAFIKKSAVNIVTSKTKGITSKSQKLCVLYNYVVKSNSYKTLPLNENERYYAYNMFKYHRGNCYAFASQFSFLAREIGYPAKVVRGRCPRYGGGTTPHGWCEIKIAGVVYTFDPDLEYELHYNAYMKPYSQSIVTYYR